MPERFAEQRAQTWPIEAQLLFWTARVRMSKEIEKRIRTAVCGEINWIRLIQLSMQHETTALLYWHLQRICPDSVPGSILEPLAARFLSQTAEVQCRAQELVRLVGSLEQEDILAVGYKGPTLAQALYGNVSLREFSRFSDLDIMVREQDLPRARDVILREGYVEECRTERELMFRQRDSKRLLELHWYFSTHLCRVPRDPTRFLQRFEFISLAGVQVRSLPLETYLLVLSLHGAKHKWRKLKLICDIAEILGSPAMDWDYVLREAGDMGLRRLLAVGVLLAQNPLEVAAPPEFARGLSMDRSARLLADECRQELLKEPDDLWRFHADLRFMFQLRERPADKMKLFLWEWLWPKTMPDDDDRRFAPLPDSLKTLYYFVRPVRLAWKEITERPYGSA